MEADFPRVAADSAAGGGDTHSAPSVLVALKNGDELRTLASTDTLSVLVTNTTDAAKTITVDLYARRLSGASQTTSLAPVTVPARGTATIPVAVKSLPNRRNGTSQTYAIAARYSDAGGARIDPGPAFAVGWDAAFGNAWVGHEIHAPEVGRRAFAALAARAGRNVPNDLEGRARLVAALQTGADVEDIDARSGARSLRKATVDEPWAVPVADSEAKLAATALSAKAPAGPNTAAMALGVPIVAPIFWKACFQFDVNGLYRDASGGNQTAYVNGLTPAAGVSLSAAWADSGSGGSASGYLDADGCFSFTFQNGKPSSISLWSSLGSFGPPGQPLNATGAKFTIFPAGENYFSPTLGTVSSFIPKSIPTQTFTLPGTEAARVGAILSRIYRMPDNGLGLGTASVWSVPGKIYIRPYLSTSQIDADGWNFLCKPYPLTAGGLGYGEACANPGYGQVSFGPLLAKTGGTDAAPTYSGISIPGFSTASYPLSLTTIDRSAIAHEIGHYVQAKMAGFLDSTYPTTSNSVTNDPDNLCSCNQVGEGNRRHCLQNRMGFAPAFNEGFGHYYAARVLNEDRTGTPSVATSCNFPYYKNVKFPLNPATPSVNQITSAPPVPVQCSAPSAVFNGQARGWQRSYCNLPVANGNYATQEGIERDVLTFLWAINSGKSYSTGTTGFSAGTGTIGMSDLATLLRRTCTGSATSYCAGNAATDSASAFHWGSMNTAAVAQFGTLDSRTNRLTTEGRRHSVDGSNL